MVTMRLKLPMPIVGIGKSGQGLVLRRLYDTGLGLKFRVFMSRVPGKGFQTRSPAVIALHNLFQAAADMITGSRQGAEATWFG